MNNGPSRSSRSSISNESMTCHFFIITIIRAGTMHVIDNVMVRNVKSLPGVKRVSPESNKIIIIHVGWKIGCPNMDMIFAVFISLCGGGRRGCPVVRGILRRYGVLWYSLFLLEWPSTHHRLTGWLCLHFQRFRGRFSSLRGLRLLRLHH